MCFGCRNFCLSMTEMLRRCFTKGDVCSASYADILRSWTTRVEDWTFFAVFFFNFTSSHSTHLLFSSVCDIIRGRYKAESMRFASNRIILNFGIKDVSQTLGSWKIFVAEPQWGFHLSLKALGNRTLSDVLMLFLVNSLRYSDIKITTSTMFYRHGDEVVR